MSPSPADADLRRAARAGRRVLARALPPAFARWIERLADDQDSPEEVFALAGALAAIALAFETSFARAGTEVRDLIMRLHDFLAEADGPPSSSASILPFPDFEPFAPWLRSRLGAPAPGPAPRIILLQWIDVAAERLTLRRYHRPDLTAHHASALLARPFLMVSAHDSESAGRGTLPDPPPIGEVALVVLRLVDLLDADRLGMQGKDRATGYHSGGMGGFYGISENVQPPSRESLRAVERDLRATALTLAEGCKDDLTLQSMLREIAAALTQKIDSGDWPGDLQWRSPAERRGRPSLWRRLLGA